MPGMPGMPGATGKDAMNPGKMLGDQFQKMAKKDPVMGEVLKGVQGLLGIVSVYLKVS